MKQDHGYRPEHEDLLFTVSSRTRETEAIGLNDWTDSVTRKLLIRLTLY